MYAKRLSKGDTICLVAPSNPITHDREHYITNFIHWLEEKRFVVIYGKNAHKFDRWGTSGGTPQERAEDINNAFRDDTVNCIWCVHGGDTANQVLKYLDFDLIKSHPKLFMGKSDIDVLLMAINQMTGLVTFHCPDPKIGANKDMDFGYSQKWFEKRIMDGARGPVESVSSWKTVRGGKATGTIMGCNLSSILKLAGTRWFPDFTDCILFIESYKAPNRKVLFQLEQLRHLGVFDKINGIVVGYIYGYQHEDVLSKEPKKDAKGKQVHFEDLVLDATEDYDFPILKINEFGHYYPNAFIPIGVQVELDADEQTIVIVDTPVS